MAKRSTHNKRSNKRSTPRVVDPSPPDEYDMMVETIDRLMNAKNYKGAVKGLILFRVITTDGDEMQQHIDGMIDTCHNYLLEELKELYKDENYEKANETVEVLKSCAEYVIAGEDNIKTYKEMIDRLIV